MSSFHKACSEQQKIIEQLNSLDKKLYNRNHPKTYDSQNTNSNTHQQYASFEQYQPHKQHPIVFQKFQNEEYFSEINHQIEDEDSLFDQGNDFLKEHAALPLFYPTKEMTQANQIQSRTILQKDEDENKEDKKNKIVRQMQYIYKRERNQSQKGNCQKQNQKNRTNNQSRQISSKAKIIKNRKSNCHQDDHGSKNKYSQQNLHSYLQRQDQNINCNNLGKHQNGRKQTTANEAHTFESYFEQIVHEKAMGEEKGYGEDVVSISISQQKGKNSKNNYNTMQSDSNSLQCTFKPKILKKSEEMMKNKKPVIERLTPTPTNRKTKMPYQPAKPAINKSSMQRIEQLSKPRKLKTIESEHIPEPPSFRPSLSKKSLEQMSNCTYDVATRNKLWQEQRQQKLNRLRKEQEEQKIKRQEGTFTPNIKYYKGQSDAHFSKFGKLGMAQYFERVSMAKKKNSNISAKKQHNASTSIIKQSLEQTKKQKQTDIVKNLTNSSLHQINKSKKPTYEQAVKQLHQKIMQMNI